MISGSQKEIKKKGLDRLRRVGAAELKENYSYSPCWVSHPPGSLKKEDVTQNPWAASTKSYG